jgi:RNA polymerase sporulation-specific sigma factor
MGFESLKLPPFTLTEEEVKELIGKAQSGDDSARDKVLQGNLRLVASLVQRFSGRGEDPEDLFQVGSIGLLKAIKRFDLSMDVRFSTYAVPVVLGEIKQYIRGNGMVKVGRSLQELATKALKKREELAGMLDREPSVNEVAAALEVDPADIVDALDAVRPVVSLFEKNSNDDDTGFLVDRISAVEEPEVHDLLDRLALSDALDSLKPREKMVLELRYKAGLTQSQVAQRFGVSQVQIFRIEKAALSKVKSLLAPENG